MQMNRRGFLGGLAGLFGALTLGASKPESRLEQHAKARSAEKVTIVIKVGENMAGGVYELRAKRDCDKSYKLFKGVVAADGTCVVFTGHKHIDLDYVAAYSPIWCERTVYHGARVG